eukprot:TRINITY_DN53364_c0_g1_i1.p1 TRINITY_DN53364_c0_g1~~TRINITY_DN53364_c0_g1_i1.p1  ORF type:complete len:419 (+),score=50.07 TRINITY_DN53364_c0_g1_i1:18-1274(+)
MSGESLGGENQSVETLDAITKKVNDNSMQIQKLYQRDSRIEELLKTILERCSNPVSPSAVVHKESFSSVSMSMPGTLGTGNIRTLAGTGSPAYNGDGQLAFKAALNSPRALVVYDNTLFFADSGNHRIRAIDLETENISTVAGVGTQPEPNSTVPDECDGRAAQLAYPQGLAVYEDKLYIADTCNNRIVALALAGPTKGKITTVYKQPSIGWNQVTGIAVDSGALYLSEMNGFIKVIDLHSGAIENITKSGRRGFGGDGDEAINAQLNTPTGLAVGRQVGSPPTSVLYIADCGNDRIRAVDLDTQLIKTIAGNGEKYHGGDFGQATTAFFNHPEGVHFCGETGMLYVADTGNHCVRGVDLATGVVRPIAGNATMGYSGDGRSSLGAQLFSPFAVVYHESKLYCSDTGNHAIRVVELFC